MKVKKYILGGLIAFFGAISYSNAMVYTGSLPGMIQKTNEGYNYTYTISKYLNFTTRTTTGTNENIKALFYTANGGDGGGDFRGSRSWILFWNNNKIAGYGNVNINGGTHKIIKEGYYEKYCTASINNYQTYCLPNLNSIGNYTTDIQQFYNKGAIYRDFYFNDSQRTTPRICFLSYYDDIASCFMINITNNSSYGDLNAFLSDNVILYTNSNEPSDFNEEKNKFGNSVFGQGYNEYACPTLAEILRTYESEYNTGLCYSTNYQLSGFQLVPKTPKSITEMWNNVQEFKDDINLHTNYCTPPATAEACQAAFSGKENQRSLINKLPDNINPNRLYRYCNLSLNYDPNMTTCTIATGIIDDIDNVDINDAIAIIGDSDFVVITPGRPPERDPGNGGGTGGAGGGGGGSRGDTGGGTAWGDENDDSSGSVYDSLIGDQQDDTKRWNVVQNAKDIIKTMKELYAKFTGIFRERGGREGIIPTYITGLILLIVLFKLWKR